MSHAHDNDLALLHRYRQLGDQLAFSQLVEGHLQSVYGTAYRDLHNVHDAEDICQRVFTKLAQKGRHVRIRNVSGWLFTVARQEVLDMKRSEGRRRARETMAAEDPSLTNADSHELMEGEPNPAVQEAFGLLKEPEQQALFLRFHDELDFKQMGTALGVSQRAAQKRLYRAMDRLRALLSKRGITASSAVVVGSLFATPSMAAPASDLSARVTQQAIFEAAATPMPPAISAWLAQPAAWITGTALIVTAGLVTATVNWQNRQEPGFETNAHESTAIQGSLLAGSQRASRGIAVDDLEAIYQFSKEAKETALIRLVNYLESKKDPAYLQDLFQRWAKLDAPRSAQALFDLLSRYSEDPDRDELLSQTLATPLETWLRQDSEGLRLWVQTLTRSRAESLTFNAVLRTLSPQDISQAFALLKERGASDDQPYHIIADGLKARGAEFTCTFLHDLPKESKQVATSTLNADVALEDRSLDPRTRLFAATIPHLFAEAPQEVADWIVGLPESQEAHAFTSAFVEQWATAAPNQAAAWTRGLESEARESVAPALLATWALQDTKAALQWAFHEGQLAHPYKAVKPAFTALLSERSRRPEMIHWLEDHVSVPEAAPLFGLASEALGARAAIDWALPLTQGEPRQQALDHAFFSHGLSDAKQGVQQLETVFPLPTRQSAALSLFEAMFIGQGRKAVARFQEQAEGQGESLIAQAAHEAQIGILAALNPKLVTDEVLSLPNGETKDRLLTKLLERTYRRSADHAQEASTWTAQLQTRGLRQSWNVRIEQALTETPWQDTADLPTRLSSGFKTQSLADFRERLDLLSRIPPLRQ